MAAAGGPLARRLADGAELGLAGLIPVVTAQVVVHRRRVTLSEPLAKRRRLPDTLCP